MTTFGTKITELQRTIELDAQDVVLLDDVGFTTAYDVRDEASVLIAAHQPNEKFHNVSDIMQHFDVVKYVGDTYATGSEIVLEEEQ